jgi:hypothetical protein
MTTLERNVFEENRGNGFQLSLFLLLLFNKEVYELQTSAHKVWFMMGVLEPFCGTPPWLILYALMLSSTS